VEYEYDDDYMGPEDNGWIHEDDLPDLDHGKAMMLSVINAIYETGDTEQLEDCLDELAALFDLRLPKKNPKLEKIKKNYQVPLAI